jgi:Ca-activated chloride channel homolog
MKKVIFLFSVVLAIFVSSCTSPGTNPSNSATSTDSSTPSAKPADNQAVIVFDTPGEVSLARNFYFLFDCSGSMEENCSGNEKIKGAKEAFLRFLKNVPADANVGLLAFGLANDDGCKEILPLGKNNYDALAKAISPLKPTDGTPLGNAIFIGTQKLVDQYKKQLGYGEYRLIVITDGQATDHGHMLKACKNLTKFGFISLYSIGLCMDTDNSLKSYALSSRDASNYEELEKALVETAAETDVFDSSVFDSTLFRK